jgi:hypothetical protein
MKYIVLRVDDVRVALSTEEREQLSKIQTKIEDFRGMRRREIDTKFFVINTRDAFAQAALEAYVKAAREDKRSLENDGVKAAIKAAQDARSAGIMSGTPKIPD